MRILLAILLMLSIQLYAEAPSSAEFSSIETPPQSWGRSQDLFVKQIVDRSKVKAFVTDLLGESRSKAAPVKVDNSTESLTAE